MNKEELIILKKQLEQKNYLIILMEKGKIIDVGDSISLSEYDKKIGVKKALKTLTESFENLIRYLSGENIEYDEITFIPTFGVLVGESDYDDVTESIRENAKILDDTAVIDFCLFSIKNEGIKKGNINIPKYIMGNLEETFVVSFKELIIELAGEGLKLEGISNFEDLKNRYQGEITIKFPKKQEYNNQLK